jgi:hypothetical protein
VTGRTNLASRLVSFARPQIAAFAAACATRIAPVFESFARTYTGRYDEWVSQLWACIPPLDDKLHELERQVTSAPEANVDDSLRPDYYAMRALGVILHAIRVLLDEDAVQQATWCSEEAISILRDFDYILETPADSAGSLATLERRAQEAWLDGLETAQQGTGRPDDVEKARAAEVFKRLKEVPAEIAKAHDWDLIAWQRPPAGPHSRIDWRSRG